MLNTTRPSLRPRGRRRRNAAPGKPAEQFAPFLGEAHLFEGVGRENPFRELCQPVQRADRLDLLPNLLRERPKPLGKLMEEELVSSLLHSLPAPLLPLSLRPRHRHRS